MIESNLRHLLETVEAHVKGEATIEALSEACKQVRQRVFVVTEYDRRFAHHLLGAVAQRYANADGFIDDEELFEASSACLKAPTSFSQVQVHRLLQKVKDRL